MQTYHFKADVTSTVVFSLDAPSEERARELWERAMRDNELSDWLYGKALDSGQLSVTFEYAGQEGSTSPFDSANIDITEEVADVPDRKQAEEGII